MICPKNEWGEIYQTNKQSDPLNLTHARTLYNTPMGDYNCGGFALETYNYFTPIVNDTFACAMEDKEENEIEFYFEAIEEDFIDNLADYIVQDIDVEYERIFYEYNYSRPAALEMAISNILGIFPELRPIMSFDDVNEDEYGIAYAAGANDFHFIKYIPKIGLFHKMGHTRIRKVKSIDEAFGERYSSERFFFAAPRKKSDMDRYVEVEFICPVYIGSWKDGYIFPAGVTDEQIQDYFYRHFVEWKADALYLWEEMYSELELKTMTEDEKTEAVEDFEKHCEFRWNVIGKKLIEQNESYGEWNIVDMNMM